VSLLDQLAEEGKALGPHEIPAPGQVPGIIAALARRLEKKPAAKPAGDKQDQKPAGGQKPAGDKQGKG